MMNKKNLWFLTLFSLVLVLSIYYVTMPNDLLKAATNSIKKSSIKEATIKAKESDVWPQIVYPERRLSRKTEEGHAFSSL